MRTILLIAIFFAASASPAAAQDMKRWEQKLQDGAEAFEARDYEAALLHYGEAQQILDVPKLRLQVAVVHEKLGQCEAARALFRSLVDDKEAEKSTRTLASEQLEQLKCDGDAPDRSDDPGIVIIEEGEPAPARRAGSRRPVGWLWFSGGTLGIVGGTLLALGVFAPSIVVDCAGYNGPINCTPFAERRGLTGSSPLELRDTARRTMVFHRAVGISTAGLGAVAAVIGLNILLSRQPDRPVAARLTPGGLELVLVW